MPIPTLPSPPVVDGNPMEFAEVAPMALDHVAWGHTDGASDITANARVAIHGTDLVVAVSVHDDKWVPGTGIAGDHVEVWLSDPVLDREDDAAAWERDVLAQPHVRGDTEDAAGIVARSRAFRVGSPRSLQVVATSSGLTDGALRAIPGEAAYRTTPEGWDAELRIPLHDLPRLGALTVDNLRVRADVIDADGKAPQDALVNATGSRDTIPELHLPTPVILGPDPWRADQLGPIDWVPSADGWAPDQIVYAEVVAGARTTRLPLARVPAKVPIVTSFPAPGPARVVDGVLQWRDHDQWRLAPGSPAAAIPDGDAASLVFVGREGADAIRGAAVTDNACVAGQLAEWTPARWTAAGLVTGLGAVAGLCGAAPVPPACSVEGLDVACTAPAPTRLVFTQDLAFQTRTGP